MLLLLLPQALERIAGLLEDVDSGGAGGLVISERGDAEGVPRHPSFRLFGAMNPATDAGEGAVVRGRCFVAAMRRLSWTALGPVFV